MKIEILRLCDHCNKEYTVALVRKGFYPHSGFVKNKVKCAHCGEYDNPWLLIKTDAFDKLEAANARIKELEAVVEVYASLDDILDNLLYWESCPEEYKERIRTSQTTGRERR